MALRYDNKRGKLGRRRTRSNMVARRRKIVPGRELHSKLVIRNT